MPRPPRSFHAEGFYHVTSRGNKHAEIFHDRLDYEEFLRGLLRHKAHFNVSIFHYCLMPNHIHILLQPHGEDGSKFMQKLKSEYAMRYCRKYGHKGHVWQGRFHNEIIASDACLLACGNYIEMNPVRAKLVDEPNQWPYSSFHHYALGKADKLIDEDPLYQMFGKDKEEKQAAYRCQLSRTRSF